MVAQKPRQRDVFPVAVLAALAVALLMAPGSSGPATSAARLPRPGYAVRVITIAIFAPLSLLYQRWTYYGIRKRLSGEPADSPVAAVAPAPGWGVPLDDRARARPPNRPVCPR